MFREPNYAETLQSKIAQKSKNLKVLKPLWQYSKSYWLRMVMGLTAISIAAFSVLGLGQGLKFLVDKGFGFGDPGLLYTALGIMSGLVFLLALSSFARVYFVSWVGERVVADLRLKVFNHLLTLDPYFFESKPVGDLVSRLFTDTTLIQVVVSTSIPIALRNFFLFFGGLFLLLITSLKLTGVIMLVFPIILFPILLYGKKMRALSRSAQAKVGDIGAHTEEIFEAIRTVQAYGRELYEINRFSSKIEAAFINTCSQIKSKAFLTMCVMTLVFAALCAVLWIGGIGVKQGTLTGGDLSSFLFYAALVSGAAGALSEIIGDLQRAAGAMERIFELLETKSNIYKLPSRKGTTVVKKKAAQPIISFQSITFSYHSRPQEKVIRDFSLDIYEGEHIAFVGASGVGKSTLFALLLRFFDPHKGKIFFQGQSIKAIDMGYLRDKISWVSQDSVIFSGTIESNVLYGKLDASLDQIVIALKAARAWEFVLKFPRKVKALVGQRGVALSGGQKQRLALARAFIKDAPLLLLDEATSALDAVNERLIQEAMDTLWKGKTCLIIAHRLATIKKADRIVLIGPTGTILGIGTHKELLKTQPIYQEMVELEFLESEKGT